MFVVAAPRPAPFEPPATTRASSADESDDGPLFIVPAVQPAQPPVAPPDTPPAVPPLPQQQPAEPRQPGPEAWRSSWDTSGDAAFEAWEEPPPRRRRWRPGCFSILLVLIVALVGGAAYAYRTGFVTPRQVLDAAGFGAAEVQIVNLRDDALRVDLAPATPPDAVPAIFRLAPYEVRTHRAVRPGDLRVTLVAPDGTAIGTCQLDLVAGVRVQLVALADGALVRRSDLQPASGRDLLVGESGSCR